jgi:hypothetical protein
MTGGVTEALAGPDAAVWHQEADLSDPGAPSRLIEPAAAISRFLDILGGPNGPLAGSFFPGDVNAECCHETMPW